MSNANDVCKHGLVSGGGFSGVVHSHSAFIPSQPGVYLCVCPSVCPSVCALAHSALRIAERLLRVSQENRNEFYFSKPCTVNSALKQSGDGLRYWPGTHWIFVEKLRWPLAPGPGGSAVTGTPKALSFIKEEAAGCRPTRLAQGHSSEDGGQRTVLGSGVGMPLGVEMGRSLQAPSKPLPPGCGAALPPQLCAAPCGHKRPRSPGRLPSALPFQPS